MKTLRSHIKKLHVRDNIHGLFILFMLLFMVGAGYYGIRVLVTHNSKVQKMTAANYMTKPLVIEIPVRYELTVDMGLTVTKYSRMTLTCYTNRVQETDSTPNHTASGRIVYEGSCAVSQDIYGPVLHRDARRRGVKKPKRKGIWPGDLIYVEKLDKYFIVEDTMNKRHKSHVDLFMYKEDLKLAQEFASKKSNVYAIRLKK